jgi:hypothetical protein
MLSVGSMLSCSLQRRTDSSYYYLILYVRGFSQLTPLQPHCGPGVDSVCNRNEYQESLLWVRERPARKAENLIAINEPTVYKMRDPRRLTTLLAS